MGDFFKSLYSQIFHYDTPKVVHINSKTLGVVNKILQLLILGYVVIYVLIIKRGYQEAEIGLSCTTTKLRGIAFPSSPHKKSVVEKSRVWDVTDIVVPASENKAFFVTTSVAITNNQTQSICPEDASVKAGSCKHDEDCPAIGKPILLGHGVSNGTCNPETNTCFIRAWCPLASDDTERLTGTRDFTVLIKTSVLFPKFKAKVGNIRDDMDELYLSNCQFDPVTAPFCPVFSLEKMVNIALEKTTATSTYSELIDEGAVIAVRIGWNCDLDYNVDECKPTFDFDRLDKGEDSKLARGYNYHYTHNYVDNGIAYRQLINAYGILFIVTADVEARKFSIVPTLLNIGSGIALLAVTTVMCDFIMLYLHPSKTFFNTRKHTAADADDAYGSNSNHAYSFDVNNASDSPSIYDDL